MGRVEKDFEKGEESGNKAMVDLIVRVVHAWRNR